MPGGYIGGVERILNRCFLHLLRLVLVIKMFLTVLHVFGVSVNHKKAIPVGEGVLEITRASACGSLM